MFPGVWRHGDWTKITTRGGVIIYGRSDSTLNRGGVRIGTSEIYRAVDKIEEIKDSLIICLEKEDGNFFMPLFVVLKDEFKLDNSLRDKINAMIRNEYTPRHVPDDIISISEVPYTISGKKVETPVKKILSGKPVSNILNQDALRNPSALDYFIEYAKTLK
jgi:acetoacetyl-CoA synthetase